MTSGERKPDTPARASYASVMRRIAIGVLVGGLSISAMVFAMAPAEVEDDGRGMYVASVSNSKKSRLELERFGGKAAVVAAEFSEWSAGLWHGRRLAGTLAAISVGAALLCFLAARIPPLDD